MDDFLCYVWLVTKVFFFALSHLKVRISSPLHELQCCCCRTAEILCVTYYNAHILALPRLDFVPKMLAGQCIHRKKIKVTLNSSKFITRHLVSSIGYVETGCDDSVKINMGDWEGGGSSVQPRPGAIPDWSRLGDSLTHTVILARKTKGFGRFTI